MNFKTFLLFAFFIVISHQSHSQRNYNEYNRIGITGGITLFDISTSDLTTKQGNGFMAGFTTRGSFRNGFDLIYGITFYGTQVDVLGKNNEVPFESSYINYTISAAQLNFLASYNIVKNHLSLEFGPVLNINSKLKIKDEKFEDYILEGYNFLKAKDIQDIGPINFHLAAGLTAGLESFRVSAQYQYGVTNMLNKLNDNDLEYSDFKGNSSTITIALVVYI